MLLSNPKLLSNLTTRKVGNYWSLWTRLRRQIADLRRRSRRGRAERRRPWSGHRPCGVVATEMPARHGNVRRDEDRNRVCLSWSLASILEHVRATGHVVRMVKRAGQPTNATEWKQANLLRSLRTNEVVVFIKVDGHIHIAT
jgi:hypothetical protein